MAKRKDVPEEMKAEFVGGPLDGAWFMVQVVREGPNRIRVLERGYMKKFERTRLSTPVPTGNEGD